MSARHQRATSDLVQLLREKAPPKPDCFRSSEDWVAFLHSCEQSGEIRVVKLQGRTGKGKANRGRLKTDEIEQEIDFCLDCPHSHMLAMQERGKCNPPAWGTIPKPPKKDAQPKSAARCHTPKLPAVPVVALHLSTWSVRVFSDIADVAPAGFNKDAVKLAIRSGQAHKGHAWKLAADFLKSRPALPKTADALAALVAHITESQLILPLEATAS